ncbi:MAG: rRNA pseudouridine synthase [Bacteroidaceae bacterium]|nr:rRNA pseudouridine synthase [Bacteroidaceae bacterium]
MSDEMNFEFDHHLAGSDEHHNNESREARDENNSGYRPQRQRIRTSRPAGSSYGGGYSSNRGGYNQEGGYQQRPRYNGGGYNQEGGYQQRPRYNNGGGYNQEGGYQQRPRYNGGGYNQNKEEGFNQEGGYNNGGGYGQQRGGYNNGGGYGQRGGYGQQRGGYNNGGGYGRPQRGGYNNGGGYGQQRGGGYGQQGGYGRPQRGGYGQQGGYGRPQRGGYGGGRGGYDPNAKYSNKKRIEYKEANIDPNAPIRLNKFLANAGVCSRREADDFIQAGVVKVNGEVVTELGTKVLRTDTILFHDQNISLEKKVYVLLNKPKDTVTTSDDPQNRKTVMQLVEGACPERIYPVGRLDRNTTGVLLLTNDGDLASKLTHPKFLKKKVYHVQLDKNVTAADMQQIADGIQLEDGEIHADAIEYAHPTDKKQVGIEIHSGRNRIVRRIFEHLGYRVIKLDRVLFAGLTKKNLRRGDWRFLTEKEVDMLRMGAFE